MSTAPILQAYDDGVHYAAWCSHCERYHLHSRANGRRVAHCSDTRSPYWRTGYVIQLAGVVSDAMRRDLKRRRPRGPEAMS